MTAQAWVTLVLGLPSLIIAFITWRQRNANDARDQWWKRVTWAVDKTLDEDPATSEVGTEALLAIWNEGAPRGIDTNLLATFAAQRLRTDEPGQTAPDEDNGDTLEGGQQT